MDEKKVHIGTGGKSDAGWRRLIKPMVLIPIVAVLVVGAGIGIFVALRKGEDPQAEANQKALESSLQHAKDESSYGNIVDNTSDLIEGDKKGEYEFDNRQLANIYMDRVAANMNLGKYDKALEDIKKIKSLSSEHLIGALQAEAESRYKLGQREEIIPVYEQLIDEMGKSEWPTRNNYIQQYEEYISMLKSGQELPLQ